MTSESRAKSKNLRALKGIVVYLKPYRWQVFGALLALILTAAITLSIGQGLRLVIDQGFGAESGEALDQAVLLFFVLVLLMAIGTYARFYLVSWIGERMSADLRRAVFHHVVQLHPGYFETNLSGEIQSRITTDTTLIQTVIGSSLSMALRNVLILLGGVTWLFITNAKLTFMVLLSVPLIVMPIMIFGRRVRQLSRKSQDKVADVGGFVSEAIKNIKVLQAFNHQQRDAERFAEQVEATFQVGLQRIRQRAMLTSVVIALVLGAVAAMIWVGGHDVIAGRISGGELAAFVFYAVMVATAVGAISEVYGELQRAAGATERLLELLQARSLLPEAEQPVSLPQAVKGELQLDAIHFSYPSRPEQAAVDGISLVLPASGSLALVGSSGAGKSTLVDLILRFYDVDQGAIRFDGVDIRQLSLQDLRRHIALVPQQPVLFSGTVLDNIRYGRPEATLQEVKAAAAAAYADEFIDQLPEGYDSYVGESGIRLSGGQRQRIAIARAILKDPKLLLLDEATSALDAESEHQVQKALQHLMQGRSTIVIAHRLATVVNVDTIAVLDRGRLVATGSHQQLLGSSPLYARWASLQFTESGSEETDHTAIDPTTQSVR